jgi:hypothetical protein
MSVFGSDNIQEEVDFLLFMPNSGNRFVNEEQAFVQLNNLAEYLSNKNLLPGQIIVYGYAAYAPNNIKSDDLSKERALTVIEELQKRGISKDLFSEPVGYGAVYQWGDNVDENARKPNRRVRILLDGEKPIPITQEVINAEMETPKVAAIRKEPFVPKYTSQKTGFKFPWWFLPLLVLFLLLFLLFKERPRKQVNKKVNKNEQPRGSETNAASEFSPEEAVTTWMVNLDEEIRVRAYELSQQRGGSGDYRDQDWYKAVFEISSWYTACGHSVFTDNGCWWASRSYNHNFPATVVS